MAKKVSMQKIAEELGLTRSAVSRALSGKKGVSEATRRRVHAAARRHGYLPGPTPAPLPTQIVLLVEDRTLREKHFWGHVTSGLVSEAPLHNCFLSIAVTDAGNPVFVLPPLLEQVGRVDGVVAMHATDLRAVEGVKRLGLPIVLVDYNLELPYDSVAIDDEQGVQLLAAELIRLGHRNFGFVGELEIPSFRARYTGLLSALHRADLFGGPPPCWRVPEDLPDRGLPTAIICCNDDWAAETVEHLRAHGLRVPEDVSVTGFDDNLNDPGRCAIPLTTLRVHREELGRWAVRALVQRLANPAGPSIRITVGVDLVLRRSHGAPRDGDI